MRISTEIYYLKKEKTKSRGEFVYWTEISDSSNNLLDHLTGYDRSPDKDRSVFGSIIHWLGLLRCVYGLHFCDHNI